MAKVKFSNETKYPSVIYVGTGIVKDRHCTTPDLI